MNSLAYQKHCVTRPIGASVMFGSIFSGLSVVQGAALTPGLVATNIGGIYVYNILQCPMEAIHGRQSAIHNFASGGIIGYLGVASGRLGVPFFDNFFFFRNPHISPPLAGAAVYGGMAFLFATVSGGKPI